jgi:hypothetical protein
MTTRPVVLVDLEATLERHPLGFELTLRGRIPAIEPPTAPGAPRSTTWRLDHWTEPVRRIDPNIAAALLPYHRDGRLALMTGHPMAAHPRAERRLAAAGLGGAPLHHVAAGEHPAYGKRRIARAVRPALTIEGDLRIAEFLAMYGYETLLVDDRFNRGPIHSLNLMRIKGADLASVLTLRLAPDLSGPEAELERAFAPA